MMNLTVGGEDASTSREFDLKTGKFVENGFVLPRSRQFVTWLDKDTLLVSRDWGSGTMTQSGFPFVVKEWKRGTPLEKAKEIYRGKETDSRVLVSSFHDKQGQTLTVIRRGVTFFESEVYLLTPQGPKRLFVPAKSSLLGLVDGHVLLVVREDWSAGGKSFAKGSLVDLNLGDLMKDAEHLKPQVVFAPSSDEYLQGVYTTAGSVLITTLKNVCGRVYVYTPTLKGWSKKPLALPENLSVGISTVSEIDDTFFLNLTGFATPPSLYLGEASKGTLKLVKSESPRFDSSNEVVEQMYATSKDGTRIPYFVVHPKGMKLDGSHPTLLYAYGGFEAPITPYYDPILGKLWLEHGGLYVVANIRGGGEYGPAWHEAGLKTHRQRIYEDFAAVGEDLIVRKITSSPHLGIMGGSASGLLMGVEMEQHPDLWSALVMVDPLLDMLRFEHIGVGASWTGEFGSVTVPAERAFLEQTSPYNQLKPNMKYPEPLIIATTNDDRVGPQHARKFAAKMEEFHEPFYYHEIAEGGHGMGSDLAEEAWVWSLIYAYLGKKLMN
jgi:prolyl oligopeptidase